MFSKIIQTLFETNDPDYVLGWLQKLVINVTRDSERITALTFDQIYTDNTLEFYKACLFVLEVNFANFFKGLKLGDIPAKAKALVK